MDPHDLDTETFETIPWSQLAPQRSPLFTRIAAGVVAAVAVIVIAFAAGAILRDEPAQVTVTLPPAAAAEPVPTPQPVPAPQQAVPAPPPVPETAALDQARLYSEADLMAVVPEQEQRAAVLRAEWFVTDYFTVDGDPTTAVAVRDALPAGIEVALPHDSGGGVSYVEWATATRVEPDGPGRYVVEVLFRTLAGSGDGPLLRMPVRGVEVRVLVEATGATAVLDLPEPIELATADVDVELPVATEPTPEIAGEALAQAAAFGTPGDTVTAGVDFSGWRIVVGVGDASGLVWPVVVRP